MTAFGRVLVQLLTNLAVDLVSVDRNSFQGQCYRITAARYGLDFLILISGGIITNKEVQGM